ncbi:MAG: acetyl-coenzyme A synthetase N-terminal domain-containing protein, partial [Pseudomonadota bacterium]
MTSYADVYGNWQADPLAFWANEAKAVDWIKPPEQILDDSDA